MKSRVILASFFLSIFLLDSEAFAKKIKLVTVEWAPYYASSMEGGGPLSRVAKEAFEKKGYDVSIEFMPWARAMLLTEKGEAHGVLGAYINPERDRKFLKSEPLAKTQVVFFSLANRSISYNSFKDLEKYRIGVVRGNSYSPEFDEYKGFTKDVADDLSNSIRKLVAQRIDLLVDARRVVEHRVDSKIKSAKGKLKVVGKPLLENNLYIIFSRAIKGSKTIVKDFNEGLKGIKANGQYSKIMGP